MNRTPAVALVSLALAACQPAETAEQAATRMQQEAAAAGPAIAAVHAKWSAHITAGHPDSVAALYAANARGMGSDEPTSVGRAAIRQSFAGMPQMGTWTIRLTTDSIWANGPLVVELGSYRATLKPAHAMPRGADTVETGKYFLRWVKEGGNWMIATDMHVADKSMMTPAQMAEMMQAHH